MVTLVPASNAAFTVAALSCEPVAVAVNGVAPVIFVLVVAVMVISAGSSSHSPRRPRNEMAFTVPSASSVRWPDVSTNPPSPPLMPPLAVMSPLKLVRSSAQMLTVPPLPLSVALARITAPCSITVSSALGVILFRESSVASSAATPPCTSPPICTSPPPSVPLALITAPVKIPTRSALMTTLPPTP